MRERQENTPPSSINGDDVVGLNDDDVSFEEMEEVEFDHEMLEGIDEDDEEMEMPEDLATILYEGHNGSAFCCDLHPSGKLAVTGGEDDRAYVWTTQNGQNVMTCTGHTDSVFFAGFSYDGVFLATVDLSGVIKVWKCNLDDNQQEPWPVAFEYVVGDLSWAVWHFGARVLISGAVSGDIYVFKIPSGETKVLKGHIKTECGKVFHDGVRLASGYKDGSLKIWDLKACKILQHIQTGFAHETWINAIDIHPEDNLLASISTDGKICLITSSNGKVVAQMEAEEDLETIAFSPDLQLGYFALGTLKGSLTIWDTARKMIRTHCTDSDENSSFGVTRLIWIKDHIVTGCLDGSVHVYDGKSGKQTLSLTGHCSQVLDLCYNAKENIILTTANDGSARIFKYMENT